MPTSRNRPVPFPFPFPVHGIIIIIIIIIICTWLATLMPAGLLVDYSGLGIHKH